MACGEGLEGGGQMGWKRSMRGNGDIYNISKIKINF